MNKLNEQKAVEDFLKSDEGKIIQEFGDMVYKNGFNNGFRVGLWSSILGVAITYVSYSLYEENKRLNEIRKRVDDTINNIKKD